MMKGYRLDDFTSLDDLRLQEKTIRGCSGARCWSASTPSP